MNSSISVVIATLGGASLQNTIDNILGGNLRPDEILICIPDTHAQNAAHLASDVVKVIATEVKGQVKQRAYGFSLVKNEMTLQLDDDIILEKDTLQQMFSYLRELGTKNVVGPVYYNKETKKCIHTLQNGFVKNCFDVMICAAAWGKKKMGTVTPVGLNYGVDKAYCRETIKPVEWLPGGCVLGFTEDLITADFFPFPGKAYSEDIYHSYFRRQNSITHWVVTNAAAYIDQPLLEFDEQAIEKKINIRRKYVRMINGPLWRLKMYEWFMRTRSKVAKGD